MARIKFGANVASPGIFTAGSSSPIDQRFVVEEVTDLYTDPITVFGGGGGVVFIYGGIQVHILKTKETYMYVGPHDTSNGVLETDAKKSTNWVKVANSDGFDKYALVEDLSNIIGVEVDEDVLADKVTSIVPSTATPDMTISVEPAKYYRIDGDISKLEIKILPLLNTTQIQSMIINFTTGAAPAVSITCEDKEIKYYAGYNITSWTTYEINLMFNGAYWIVAYGVIE